MFRSRTRRVFLTILVVGMAVGSDPPRAAAQVTREQVESAIRAGVKYLITRQNDNGSWSDVEQRAHTGTTGLVALALLTAGEKPDSPAVAKAINHLQKFAARDLDSVYAVSLQTMVFAAADPVRFKIPIADSKVCPS